MIKNSEKEALGKGTILEGKNFRYKIAKVLGLGSFGITYLADIINAQGEKTNMQVALKELFLAECNDRKGCEVHVFSNEDVFKEFHGKFSREADNLHKISHSNIINVYESFEANNTVYYSMTYIEGGSLDKVLAERKKLRPAEALETAQVLANALDELHSLGLLHLDVRPENILMNGGKVPVLIDFGLAKHFDDKGEPDTSIGLGNGAAGYAPMEQASYQPGNGIPRSIDVYSLGATLFKMVTGDEPPTASEIFNYGFPREDLERAGVATPIIDIIEKAMQPLWKDRYQTASHFEKAIKVALQSDDLDKVPVSETADSKKNEESKQEAEKGVDKIAPVPTEEIEEATSIESYPAPAPANTQNEHTQISADESTSISYPVNTGYTPDEGTQVEMMPTMPPVAPPVMPPVQQKRKRTNAYILIAAVVAFILVLVGSDLYTGWIREIFRQPVECVVLEGDESDIQLETTSTDKPAPKNK